MIVLILFFLIMTALLATEYCLYRMVFCYPLKKRPNPYDIPESNLYKEYREAMLKVVDDMEKTPFEKVDIASRDELRLYGKLYVINGNAPLVIFLHGYHGVPAWDGYGFFKICKENDMNILMVDERAHGQSEGNAITFGIKERYDCKLWVDYAVKQFGENTDIFLAGVSMGAASVMMASELGLPQNVKAIIADCGYSDQAEIIKETIRKIKLPVKPMYQLVKLGARIFGHFDLEEATALEAVKTTGIPTLFIQGMKDSVVPLAMSQILYENCAGRKEIVLIEDADHANSAMTNYATYEKAVMLFLSQCTSITQ